MAYPYPITPGFPNNATTGQFGIFRTSVFVYGGVQYTLLGPYPANAPPYRFEGPVNCYKSADNGVTWTLVDGAGSPIVMNRDDLSEPSSREAVLKAGTTSVILLPYVKWLNLPPGNRGGEMCFVEFDMATETWGTPVEGGPIVLPTDVSDQPNCLVIGQYCPTTDKYVFVYNGRWGAMLPAPYSHKPVWSDIVECSGAGVWGAPAVFAGGGADTFNSVVRGVVADPDTEKLHWIWITQQWGSTAVQYSKMYHTLYTPATSALSAPALIDTGTGVYGEANAGIGVYGPAQSFGACVQPPILTRGRVIVVPFVMDQPLPNQLSEPYGPSMVVAKLEDSPTWTTHPVTAVLGDQITTGQQASGGWQIIDANAGRLRGYWSNPAGSNGFVIQTADFSLITMTWGPVGVAYTHPDADFSDQLSVDRDNTPVMPVWSEVYPKGSSSYENWSDIALSFYGNIQLLADYYDGSNPGTGRLWLSTDYGFTWVETRPAGDVDRYWIPVAINDDGDVRLAAVRNKSAIDNNGRVYRYTGGAWSETTPEIAKLNQDWYAAAMTPDGTKMVIGSSGNLVDLTSGYLYTSTNTGATWTKREPKGAGVTGFWSGLGISDDGQTILAGDSRPPLSADPSRLWLSADGGATWAETQPAGNVDRSWDAVAVSRDGQLMIAGSYGSTPNTGRLYKSVDGGTSWAEIQPAGNTDQDWFTASISADRLTIMVGTNSRKLWVSIDSGTTWTDTQPAGNVNVPWWSAPVSGEGSIFGSTFSPGFVYGSGPQEPDALILSTVSDGADFAMNFWEIAGSPAPPSPFDLTGTATVPSAASVFPNGVVSLVGGGGIGGGSPVMPGGYPAHYPGYPIWPPIFKLPNEYDRCLQGIKYWRECHPITDSSRCVSMVELWGGNDVPLGLVEFWKPFKIVTPVPGDTLVGEFKVPTGYRGMLYGIHLGYTGTGFEEGSGDILWRVQIGNAWAAKGLGNVSTQLGAPNQCLQLTDYIKVKSNQLIRVWVNVPNGSGNIQVGNSRILATLQGWYYPL